jgi:hypothetical protein
MDKGAEVGVTTPWTGCSGVRIPVGARDFSVLKTPQTDWGQISLLFSRAVESESEGILGGVGVGRNFRWSRSWKEF